MKKFLSLLSAVIFANTALAQTAVKIEMSANDEMKFNTRSITVEVGQKVTLVFKNTGTIPLSKMGHNLVILRPDTPLVSFASKCANPKAGYLPEDPETKQLIFAATKRLGGGESDTIYFIPKEPGRYPFLCTTPGHFSEMQGIMTVKEKLAP
jgi:azurin